jgi:hypothetical protein
MTTLINTSLAAVILGVTPRRIQQLVQAEELTNRGTPRHIRLSVDEVSDFAYSVRSCRTAPKGR